MKNLLDEFIGRISVAVLTVVFVWLLVREL
jgi:hypothetical protein